MVPFPIPPRVGAGSFTNLPAGTMVTSPAGSPAASKRGRFADLPKYRDSATARWMGHTFDRVCREHGIEHRGVRRVGAVKECSDELLRLVGKVT